MYLDPRSRVCVAMMGKFGLIGFMVLLAALDFAGTMLAKEWTIHRQTWQLVLGATAFLVLFAVLVIGLRYAEMSIVTLGWIVVLQAAVIVVDRSRYGTTITPGGWVAIVAIVVLQGYLVLGATETATPSSHEIAQSRAASAAS
jgi:hypothetical protein